MGGLGEVVPPMGYWIKPGTQRRSCEALSQRPPGWGIPSPPPSSLHLNSPGLRRLFQTTRASLANGYPEPSMLKDESNNYSYLFFANSTNRFCGFLVGIGQRFLHAIQE